MFIHACSDDGSKLKRKSTYFIFYTVFFHHPSQFVECQLSPWYNFYRQNEDQMAISAGILPTLSCPYGHYRDFTKGIMLDGCVKCPRGYFGNSTGLHTPNCTAPCPAGTYLDRRGGKGMEDCIPCPAGCFGEEEGLTKDSCTGRCEEIHRNTGKRYYGTDTGLTSRDRKFLFF